MRIDFDNFRIGFEFEFQSKESPENLKKIFHRELDKKIIIPYYYTKVEEQIKKQELKQKKNNEEETVSDEQTVFQIFRKIRVHSNVAATEDTFKLEVDYSGFLKENDEIIQMYELITGPLKYYEARIALIKILKLIQQYGFTTSRAGLHINISYFNPDKPEYNLLNINKLKFCLSFNENYIYDFFPNRRNNVYAASIKNIFLKYNQQIFLNLKNENFLIFDPSAYILPSSKYYGINFKKMEGKNDSKDAYLEYRYIGGQNYHKKIDSILKILDFLCSHFYYNIISQEFTDEELFFLKKLSQDSKKIIQSFLDYRLFEINYPELYLYYDLKNDFNFINNLYRIKLRHKIFDILFFLKVRKGFLNYDSDVDVLQINEVNIKNVYAPKLDSSYEIMNSTIQSSQLSDLDFYHCEIENSILTKCKLHSQNCITDSKVIDCESFSPFNIFENCYIDFSSRKMQVKVNFTGVFKKCIFRKTSMLDMNQLQLENCVLIE